ncbi:hypothetical protein HK104_009838 [Borealophlyctis nickersoniae]|nr:hypothetical protein HK104_009838 [Borealophlyctis nickersoniae]
MSGLYPTVDDLLVPNANVEPPENRAHPVRTAPPGRSAAPGPAGSAPPPIDVHNLLLPKTTCSLVPKGSSKARPLGTGSLAVTTRPAPHPGSNVATFSLGDWEIHLPRGGTQVDRVTESSPARAAPAAEGGRVYDVRVPSTARMIRKPGGAMSRAVSLEAGKMRVVVEPGCPKEVVKAFESVFGVKGDEEEDVAPPPYNASFGGEGYAGPSTDMKA